MPPLIIKEYSKDLCSPPQGIQQDNSIYIKNFFNPVDRSIYRLSEYKIKDSIYTGCIEVKVFIYSKEHIFAEEFAKQLYEEHQNKELAAKGALDLQLPCEEQKIIARYVFQEITIYFQEVKEGKQIKGAYVDSEYINIGITKEVYLDILNRYSILVSDNVQSIEGHYLWAFGVCKWGKVFVYDSYAKKILSRLLPTGNTPEKAIIPWSISDLDSYQLENLREGFWIGNQSLRHLILVLQKEQE